MHLDLGSGSLKLRASNHRLDDGTWHKVDVVRNRKRGNLQVSEKCWISDKVIKFQALKMEIWLKKLDKCCKTLLNSWHKVDIVRNRKRGNLQVSDRKKH